MLDTLQTVNKFKRLYNAFSLGKGYVEFKNFDYGPVFHPWFNEVEGIRLRVVVERILDPMTPWLQAYTAYGFDDTNLNMACRENGWLIRKTESLFWGNRRDIEQIS
jgi:hypothetical protein